MDAYLNDMDLRQSLLVQIVNCVTCFAQTDTHYEVFSYMGCIRLDFKLALRDAHWTWTGVIE